MSAVVPTNANQFVEQQLNDRLLAIEEVFCADALCVVAPMVFEVDDLIREMVEDLRQRDGSRNRLAVLLTTGGGSIEIVHRIVETLRHHYAYVNFIIPNYAYSAGTVLAMSGDDISMDYYSRLGPIDPQIQNASGHWVPASGYLIQWERLLDKARDGTLTTAEAQLMLTGFDQAALYQYEQARKLTVRLLKDWLVAYKFKNWTVTEERGVPVDDDMRRLRAEEIASELNNTERWHSHGIGISMEILQRDLKVQIDDLDADLNRCEKVRQYDRLLADYLRKLGITGMLHTIGRYRPLF